MTDQYPETIENNTAITLVVGLGDLGRRIATQALQLGGPVMGMRRRNQPVPGVKLWCQDAASPWSPVPELVADVVFCLAPGERTPTAYEGAYTRPAAHGLAALQRWVPEAHVWLISSTSVYPQSAGEWIDETAPANPERTTARLIRKAEQAWLAGTPNATVLRPAGLYGPGREALVRQAAEGFRVMDTEPVYTNRIHVDDAARAVVHLIAQRRRLRQRPPAVVNLTDKEPVSMQTLIPWLQQVLGVTPDHERTLGRGSKRISSQLLADSGFVWHYPTFREGYESLLRGRITAADPQA